MLVEWLKESWLLASMQVQQTELRGGTLLLALPALAVALCTTNRRPTADKYQSRPATAGFFRLDKGIG
jgi:hypothetical protein